MVDLRTTSDAQQSEERYNRIQLGFQRIAVILGVAVVCAPLFSSCTESEQEIEKYKEKIYQTYHENVKPAGDLTDEKVVQFINTYRILRNGGTEYLNLVVEQKGDIEKNKGVFEKIETDIKKGGFADFADFVRVSAKIAWAWNVSQGQIGMKQQDRLQKWGQHELEEAKKTVTRELNNPEVPEETKMELRKTLQQLNDSQTELRDEYQKNKKWADYAMNQVTPLTNQADMQVVMRHEKELMQLFTGLTPEQLEQIQKYTNMQLDKVDGK